MNVLDLYTKLYSALKTWNIVPVWVLSPFRRIIRVIANKHIVHYFKAKHHIRKKSYSGDIVVSLTSFPARINSVWQVVECMLHQTCSPQKIILWLSSEQFINKKNIPDNLQSLQSDIFEIRLVSGDIKSHKKYYYVSKEYPSKKIVLIDDDIYYPTNFLEKLDKYFEKYKTITAFYGCLITRDKTGELTPYTSWTSLFDEMDNDDFFFGSGGGVIFVPNLLFKDLTNISLALKLCPSADDIWLNAMVRLSGLKVHKLKSGPLLPIIQKDNSGTLSVVNVGMDKNDIQLCAINKYYMGKMGVKVF